jgi:hypothetical protein
VPLFFFGGTFDLVKWILALFAHTSTTAFSPLTSHRRDTRTLGCGLTQYTVPVKAVISKASATMGVSNLQEKLKALKEQKEAVRAAASRPCFFPFFLFGNPCPTTRSG